MSQLPEKARSVVRGGTAEATGTALQDNDEALAGQSRLGRGECLGRPRLLRLAEVRNLTGLSRSTIWRLERAGAFPHRVRVSSNVVAWSEEKVVRWIHAKIQSSGC